MIIVRLLGGLGNQLFIYAFARSLELKYKTSVYLDIFSGYKNDPYKREYELNKFNTCIKEASSINSYYFPLQKRFPLLTKLIYPGSVYMNENISGDFDTSIFNKAKDYKIFIEGYWQNPAFFKDYFSLISEEMEIISAPKEDNIKLAQLINGSESVGIHIRRLNFETLVPVQFYSDSINILAGKLSNPVFFCFSDNIEWCKTNLKIDPPLYFVENNSIEQVEDFRLLTYCRHFIISNSTFAWWAARLAKNENKNIIYPNKQFWNNKKLLEEL